MERALILLILVLAIFGLIALLGESDVEDAAAPVGSGASGAAPEDEPATDAAGLVGRESEPAPQVRETPAERMRRIMDRIKREQEAFEANAVLVNGFVVDHLGQGAANVLVYQVPNATPEGTHRGRRTAMTKAGMDGGFTLHAQKPLADFYIVAKDATGRLGWVEGADVVAGTNLRIVLSEPTVLEVHVVDEDGKPLANEGVQGNPLTGAGPSPALPGPLAPLTNVFEATDELGRAFLRLPRSVPIVVKPILEGRVANPPERWLEDSSGSVVFAAQKGARVEIRAVDAATKALLEHRIWVTVYDHASGKAVTNSSSENANGRLETDLALLPGRYEFEVTMEGREPTLLPGVVVPASGATVKLVASMPPLRDPGVLELRIPAPSKDVVPAKHAGPVTVFLKRLDGDWSARGWIRRSDLKGSLHSGGFAVGVRPGRYDVMVCVPSLQAAAVHRDVKVEPVTEPGAEPARTIVNVRLRDGLMIRPRRVLPKDAEVRTLEVELPGLGTFPAFGISLATQGTVRVLGEITRVLDRPGRRAAGSAQGGLLLGPYPGRRAVLVVSDWQGDVRRFPTR